MKYRTRMIRINKNESLKVRHVMGGFVAIVGLGSLGKDTRAVAGGRNERECMRVSRS